MSIQAVCPHCSHAARLHAASVEDHVTGVKGQWDLYHCNSVTCGLVFVFPQPSDAQLQSYYQNYITHEAPDLERRETEGGFGPKVWLKNSNAHRQRELIYLHKPPFGKVLEVGCGNGSNLYKLRARGWQVFGQEIDPPAVAQARKLGLTVHEGDLDGLDAAPPFDAIILVHVIEHLLRPVEVLQKARERMAGKGRLILITPNPKSLGFRLFKGLWAPLAQPFHVRLYDLHALEGLVRRAGFKPTIARTNSTHAASNIRASIDAARRAPKPTFFQRLLRRRSVGKAVELTLLFVLLIGDRLSSWIGDECVLICER